MSHLNVIPYSKVKPIMKDMIQDPPRSGCAVFIGEPGIGKTAGWRQAIHECGVKGAYLNAGIMTLADILGCGMPSEDNQHTVYLPHKAFDPEAHFLIDEVTNASDRSTFTALTNLGLEGHIPGHPHDYRKSRIMACNPSGTSDLAETLPRILVNRAAVYSIDYSFKDFINFALNEGAKMIHPVVASFISETKDNYLHVKDYTPSKKVGVEMPGPDEPFPSPRQYELLSDRLRRMERGLPTTVFEESYATVGVTAGKAFGDHWAVYKYLPRVTDILAGKNPKFPDAAFKGGVVLGPLQMMTVFGILGGAEDHDQFRNGCEWLFAQLKSQTVGRELLRTFADAAKESVHRSYQHEVLNALGSKAMGAKEWTQFLLGSLKSAKEASNF